MAIVALDSEQHCIDFFRESTLAILQHWQNQPAIKTLDLARLDQDREEIIRVILFALQLHEAWPVVDKLIVDFSPYMERRSYLEMWQRVITQAIEVAQQLGDSAAEVQLSVFIARLLNRQNKPKAVITAYRRTIRLARQVGDLFNEARACTNLGYLYIEHGRRWYRAEVLCCHALSIFGQLDNGRHGQAHTENHLGALYTRQCRWEAARLHLERACALWQAMGDDHGLMYGFMNLGALYIEIESPDLALGYLDQALQQAELTGEKAVIGVIYLNIGYAYRLKGQPDQAELYARQAEGNFRQFSNTLYLPWAWLNLGEALIDQGEWQKAETFLQSAMEIWRKENDTYGQIKALMAKLEYELARKNLSNATTCLTELVSLVKEHRQPEQRHQLQSQLQKYRRSLDQLSTQTAADEATNF